MSLENLPYKVLPSKEFSKTLQVPTSKSHANRALIVGALRGQSFKVYDVPESSDVANLLRCFKSMGLHLSVKDSTVEFLNCFPACEKQTTHEIIDLHTGDGGTTNRFLIALLARGKKTYRLFPTERMVERPINDLLAPLKSLGVSINTSSIKNEPWVTIQGPADFSPNASVDIDCSKSTQFATAMLLAFSDLPLKINCLNVDASALYLKLTQELLNKTHNTNSYTVPVDFSSMGYPAVLAALFGKLEVKNCKERDLYQADSVILEILQQSGACVDFTREGLLVQKHKDLRPFSIRVKDCPDLFPTLVFLAAHIDGQSRFTELDILRFKESDRLQEVLNLLKIFNVSFLIDEKESTLAIHGKGAPAYPLACIKPPRDHRIVMCAYLFMRANSGGELYEVDCVEKSFPHFFTELE